MDKPTFRLAGRVTIRSPPGSKKCHFPPKVVAINPNTNPSGRGGQKKAALSGTCARERGAGKRCCACSQSMHTHGRGRRRGKKCKSNGGHDSGSKKSGGGAGADFGGPPFFTLGTVDFFRPAPKKNAKVGTSALCRMAWVNFRTPPKCAEHLSGTLLSLRPSVHHLRIFPLEKCLGFFTAVERETQAGGFHPQTFAARSDGQAKLEMAIFAPPRRWKTCLPFSRARKENRGCDSLYVYISRLPFVLCYFLIASDLLGPPRALPLRPDQLPAHLKTAGGRNKNFGEAQKKPLPQENVENQNSSGFILHVSLVEEMSTFDCPTSIFLVWKV